jgi:uroporphyrinogen III methyltransferase/synthase
VGPKTAEALVSFDIPVHQTARVFRAEGLATVMKNVKGKRFLFPRALQGRDSLREALVRRGARVDLWPVYRTVSQKLDPILRKALSSGRVDAVAFASGSAADSFMAQFSAAARRKIFLKTRAVSIGPVTSRALRAWGVKRPVEAVRSTLEDMATALERRLRR